MVSCTSDDAPRGRLLNCAKKTWPRATPDGTPRGAPFADVARPDGKSEPRPAKRSCWRVLAVQLGKSLAANGPLRQFRQFDLTR